MVVTVPLIPALTEGLLPKIISARLKQGWPLKTYSYLKEKVKYFTGRSVIDLVVHAVKNRSVQTEFKVLQIPQAFAIIDSIWRVRRAKMILEETEAYWISKKNIWVCPCESLGMDDALQLPVPSIVTFTS